MPATKKASLLIGSLLFFSFFGVLALIFSPIFGGKNGLDFADDLFNKLSKGSAYFVPELLGHTEKRYVGKPFRVTIQVENDLHARQIADLLARAGARVESQGLRLSVNGDLGQVLRQTLRDSDAMFKNRGENVTPLAGCDCKEVMHRWWLTLSKMDRAFKKDLQIEHSKGVSEVLKKAVEPAYNFYRVEDQRVADRAGIMIFLLVFYVVYTLWWGYAIFYLFEGLGLSMKKAKVKKEM